MKGVFTILLFLISSCVFAQSKDSVRTEIPLTQKQESTLMDLDAQIISLQKKQKELLDFIFDSKGYDINLISDLKYEKGKFIFSLKKKIK